jgi:hypothetical protein
LDKVKLKTELVDKIREHLNSELADLSPKNLHLRLQQVQRLLEKYLKYPQELLAPDDNIREGSIVLVVEQRWDGPKERWYFIGFGGELPVQCSGREFHVVPLKHFQGIKVGESFLTEEGRPGEQISISHRLVYVT